MEVSKRIRWDTDRDDFRGVRQRLPCLYDRACPDLVCVVTLKVTDAADQSGSVSMRMVFVNLTPD